MGKGIKGAKPSIAYFKRKPSGGAGFFIGKFYGAQQMNAIAMAFGYSDEAVFRRLFRKQVGMSPLDIGAG